MLTMKEMKEMVQTELHTIAVYSTCDNLQKFIPSYEKKVVSLLEAMVEVYNHQHKCFIYADEIIETVLKENYDTITERLEKWYKVGTEERYIALEIIYRHK